MKKDKIDSLLEIYKRKKRIRKARQDDLFKEENKQLRIRTAFEEKVWKMLSTLADPVMAQLLNRMKKAGFKTSAIDYDVGRMYEIQSVNDVDERGIYLVEFADEGKEKVVIAFGWDIDDESKESPDKKYNLSEINEEIITNTFTRALEKICR